MSTASYFDVKKVIADQMEVNVRELSHLLYKIPVDRNQTSFHELASDEDWLTILEVGRAFRIKQLKKKDGTGNPDEWAVKVKEEEGSKSKVSKVCVFYSHHDGF
jgi:hypothetical protein